MQLTNSVPFPGGTRMELDAWAHIRRPPLPLNTRLRAMLCLRLLDEAAPPDHVTGAFVDRTTLSMFVSASMDWCRMHGVVAHTTTDAAIKVLDILIDLARRWYKGSGRAQVQQDSGFSNPEGLRTSLVARISRNANRPAQSDATGKRIILVQPSLILQPFTPDNLLPAATQTTTSPPTLSQRRAVESVLSQANGLSLLLTHYFLKIFHHYLALLPTRVHMAARYRLVYEPALKMVTRQAMLRSPTSATAAIIASKLPGIFPLYPVSPAKRGPASTGFDPVSITALALQDLPPIFQVQQVLVPPAPQLLLSFQALVRSPDFDKFAHAEALAVECARSFTDPLYAPALGWWGDANKVKSFFKRTRQDLREPLQKSAFPLWERLNLQITYIDWLSNAKRDVVRRLDEMPVIQSAMVAHPIL